MAQRSRQAVTRPESESQVQEKCAALLFLDGWRRIRTDMKHLRGMGVQEPGMADDLFMRFNFFRGKLPLGMPERVGRSVAQVLWIEWKRKKGSTQQNQHAWHLLERMRGALTVKAKEDFPATVDGFLNWYNDDSGLAIKRLTLQ